MSQTELEYGPTVLYHDIDGPTIDYKKAFTEGTVYYNDEAKEGFRKFTISVQQSLTLELPTGEIVLSAPELLEFPQDEYRMQRRVKPGRYPTVLSTRIDEDGRSENAAWRVNFSADEPVRWEPGLERGCESPFEPYQIAGLGGFIDGCFGMCDASFLKNVREFFDAEDKDLFADFYQHGFFETDLRMGAIEIKFPQLDGHYLGTHAAFSHHCFWGLNSSDSPVCLVNDFEQLDREAMREEVLGSLKDCVSKRFTIETPVGQITAKVQFEESKSMWVSDLSYENDNVSGLCYIGSELLSIRAKRRDLSGDEVVTVRYRVGTESIPILIEE